MNAYGYRQLPIWWTRNETDSLKIFKGGKDSGVSIAALKVLLGLCSLSDMGGSYSVEATYQKIQDITGLSRPMIAKGIRKLEAENIVLVNRQGYISNYTFNVPGSDTRYSKVPSLEMHRYLKEIPNKGEAALSALKIYIYVLSRRSSGNRTVAVSYERIRAHTGIGQKRVRTGIDILINHFLIHVIKAEEIDNPENNFANRYKILGDLGKR